MKLRKLFLVPIFILIGIPVFLFGTPRIIEKLNEKYYIEKNALQKLEIIESVSTTSTLEVQKIAKDTRGTYLETWLELCRKQYFNLKTDCKLSDLNKSNLRKLNQILETGILEIVEVEKQY
ncbi:MAG: hypothetical protein O3B87_01195 [bacterium]|nr:hypothetical protein [bacterium]